MLNSNKRPQASAQIDNNFEDSLRFSAKQPFDQPVFARLRFRYKVYVLVLIAIIFLFRPLFWLAKKVVNEAKRVLE